MVRNLQHSILQKNTVQSSLHSSSRKHLLRSCSAPHFSKLQPQISFVITSVKSCVFCDVCVELAGGQIEFGSVSVFQMLGIPYIWFFGQ